MAGLLAAGWLTCWLAYWLACWLAGLARLLACLLAGWADWLAGPAGWLQLSKNNQKTYDKTKKINKTKEKHRK